MPISMSDAVQRTVEHREIFHDEMLGAMTLDRRVALARGAAELIAGTGKGSGGRRPALATEHARPQPLLEALLPREAGAAPQRSQRRLGGLPGP